MATRKYVTAQEATEMLGVSAATLYAYVSRGLIRSESTEGKTRRRRYHREDIERLKERKEMRRNPTHAAAKALHLGSPVLESALTLIADGRLYYRGQDATKLAVTWRVEDVAALLWCGEREPSSSTLFGINHWQFPTRCATAYKRLGSLLAEMTPIERFQTLLPIAATEDVAAYDLRPLGVAQTGVRILRLLTAIAVGTEIQQGSNTSIAQTLQQGWLPRQPASTSLLQAALILCADHELNVSAFTARCVASANSTPYAVVAAGLSALQGAKHGGYTDQVEAFLREVHLPAHARTIITNRLKRGEHLPGFGQPLYPEGDPRAKTLLDLIARTYPQSEALALGQAVTIQVRQMIGQHPTIDFALATLTRVLGLSAGIALALFALGRTIGWIGHAIEQYQLDQLIRPRAQYTGPAPLLT